MYIGKGPGWSQVQEHVSLGVGVHHSLSMWTCSSTQKLFKCGNLQIYGDNLCCWERLKAEGEGDDRGCHHQLNGHEFEQILEDSEGQGSMTCQNTAVASLSVLQGM